MEMNVREIWTVVHGMVFGFIFLLGFSGALYAVYTMKSEWRTTEGMSKAVNIIKVYLWGLAISVWAAVFTQTFLLASDQKVTKEVLASWLDQNIPHKDVPQHESRAFFLGMVERLLEKQRWALGELWREKYRLKEAARKKVESIRKTVKADVFAKTLFSISEYELVASPELCFTFDPEEYPYPPNSLFEGHHKFKKHYYKVVGDMKAEGEEFQCAQLLDNHPKVKRWVRNLEGRPGHSFWLQTSTDRFYPDFVCELTDDRSLVVEYKGFDRWSDDDSREKRAISQVWEEKSAEQCLFTMPKGPDWNAILAKLG